MILSSNTVKTNVTEFIFLLEKPSLQSSYIGKVAHLFSGDAVIVVFVTSLWEKACKPIGAYF